MRKLIFCLTATLATISLSACAGDVSSNEARWLAGDHHVHSRLSVGYDREHLPAYRKGGDAIYPIPMNALMAHYFGLSWMVTTDHGGPGHSKIDLDLAYPELVLARAALPDMILFYGMELNSPAADHSSLIIPHIPHESETLHTLESRFDSWEVWPRDPARNEPPLMLEALRTMDALPEKPVVIANHPSRSATGVREYGLDEPAELRSWNDTAPDVAVGMAGAPGHQAAALSRVETAEGIRSTPRARGAYSGYPTNGGFDQMTAIVGGFWDSMLGEGRHWWITANSDSHVHYTEGGIDFWPGEYSKTYVFAKKEYGSILEALRHGRIFVTTGDLISSLDLTASSGRNAAAIGEELTLARAGDVTVEIRFTDPDTPNFIGDNPQVRRVDLIVGDITGNAADPTQDVNPTTRVEARFTSSGWKSSGTEITIRHVLPVDRSLYLRVRGTSTDELEPAEDAAGENPWKDLWFYSNPIFVTVRGL